MPLWAPQRHAMLITSSRHRARPPGLREAGTFAGGGLLPAGPARRPPSPMSPAVPGTRGWSLRPHGHLRGLAGPREQRLAPLPTCKQNAALSAASLPRQLSPCPLPMELTVRHPAQGPEGQWSLGQLFRGQGVPQSWSGLVQGPLVLFPPALRRCEDDSLQPGAARPADQEPTSAVRNGLSTPGPGHTLCRLAHLQGIRSPEGVASMRGGRGLQGSGAPPANPIQGLVTSGIKFPWVWLPAQRPACPQSLLRCPQRGGRTHGDQWAADGTGGHTGAP